MGVGLCLGKAAVGDDAASMLHSLQYQFRKGDVVRYLVNDQSKVDIEQQGAKTDVAYTTTSWKRYTVREIDDKGVATLVLKIDRVKMKAGGDGTTIEFDSSLAGRKDVMRILPPAAIIHPGILIITLESIPILFGATGHL